MNAVTRILSAIEQGDAPAAADLLPLVYDELRKLARDREDFKKLLAELEKTSPAVPKRESHSEIATASGWVASGNVDIPTRHVGASVPPVGLILTPYGVATGSRKPNVISGGSSCRENASVSP